MNLYLICSKVRNRYICGDQIVFKKLLINQELNVWIWCENIIEFLSFKKCLYLVRKSYQISRVTLKKVHVMRTLSPANSVLNVKSIEGGRIHVCEPDGKTTFQLVQAKWLTTKVNELMSADVQSWKILKNLKENNLVP